MARLSARPAREGERAGSSPHSRAPSHAPALPESARATMPTPAQPRNQIAHVGPPLSFLGQSARWHVCSLVGGQMQPIGVRVNPPISALGGCVHGG